jgi:hypothetical protein
VHGPKVFLYRMEQTEGATKSGAALWTPAELKERWAEIGK